MAWLALTSPTSGSRSVGIVHSRTNAVEFSFSLVVHYSCTPLKMLSWQLTICTSSSIPCGALPARTLEQMKSTKVGSGSPMYSMIFLLIHGRMRLSINCCKCMSKQAIMKALCTIAVFSVHHFQTTSN
jgi:hypothetical protein